jgi:hypothetical protein
MIIPSNKTVIVRRGFDAGAGFKSRSSVPMCLQQSIDPAGLHSN